MAFHKSTQERHVVEVRERNAQHSESRFGDYLTLARQRRAGLGQRLADVRAAELRDSANEGSAVRQAPQRRNRGDVLSGHQTHVTALQRVAATNRATALSVSGPRNTAPAGVTLSDRAVGTTQTSAPSLAPMTFQAFSDILESSNSDTRVGHTASIPASIPAGNSLSAYQATVEDTEDA